MSLMLAISVPNTMLVLTAPPQCLTALGRRDILLARPRSELQGFLRGIKQCSLLKSTTSLVDHTSTLTSKLIPVLACWAKTFLLLSSSHPSSVLSFLGKELSLCKNMQHIAHTSSPQAFFHAHYKGHLPIRHASNLKVNDTLHLPCRMDQDHPRSKGL